MLGGQDFTLQVQILLGFSFPFSFNSSSPPLPLFEIHFPYSRCSRVSSSFPWQQLPRTSRAFNPLKSGSSGLRAPFLPAADVARQAEAELRTRQRDGAELFSAGPKSLGGVWGGSDLVQVTEVTSPTRPFSLFPVREALLGTEERFLGHPAGMRRLPLSGLQGEE